MPFRRGWVRSGWVVAITAALSWSCGGTTTDDSEGEDVKARASGGSRSILVDADSAGGETPATGGRRATGGATAAGASPGAAECPIRVSGTLLTEEDCHACIPPGTTCKGNAPAGSSTITAELCVSLIRMNTTLYCEWYADDDRFTKPWGVVVTCPSNPGRVVCGGGL